MATLGQWVEGARPRTLPAAVSSVIVGTAAAVAMGRWEWDRAVLAAVVALALQIGVNYANDYSDGIRGTDEVRVGPVRLVGQKLTSPRSVKFAAFVSFAVAGVAGLVLAALVAWWLIAVGVAAIAAAWFYTGGTHPYGYYGLGEVFVFVFFGLVATLGTQYVQVEAVSGAGLGVAISIGSLITAILVANNLRDIGGDRVADKRTLAVRLGDQGTRRLYQALIGVAIVAAGLAIGWSGWLGLLVVPIVYALGPIRRVRAGKVGPELIAVLASTGRLALVTSVASGAALILVQAGR
ncbi:MAG: 1,4-dihydroxy-2-naphthoate polyprenyltransferase [Ferrimicrobium sp.]